MMDRRNMPGKVVNCMVGRHSELVFGNGDKFVCVGIQDAGCMDTLIIEHSDYRATVGQKISTQTNDIISPVVALRFANSKSVEVVINELKKIQEALREKESNMTVLSEHPSQ